MKKFLLLITVALIATMCHAQTDTAKKDKALYNAQFKWHITIPAAFNSISDEDYAALQQKGTKTLQGSVDGKIENHTKRIFVFKSDAAHYFESNYQPFDEATDGSFVATCKAVDNVVFDAFKKQIPADAKMDSTITTETIDGLVFQRFKMNMQLNNVVLTLLMYNRLFDKNEFTVTIFYVDQAKGEQIMTAWRNSKFEKN